MTNEAYLPSDAQLVEAARTGDAAAFQRLVERHHGPVFAIAYARLGNAESAEDAAQEVFLRAWLHLARLEDSGRFAAWLGRIARNLAADWAEGRARRLAACLPLEDVPEPPDPAGEGARAAMEREEETEWLRRAIMALPEEQREMVLLHYMEGLSKKEIARRLEVHPSTVGRQLGAALKALKRSLEPLMRAVAPTLKPRRAAARAGAVIAAAALLSAGSRAGLAAAAPLPPVSLAAPLKSKAAAAASSFFGNLLLAPLHAILAALNSITPAAAAGGQMMGLGKLFVSIAALAALAGLGAGGFYYFGNSKPQAGGIYIKSADGTCLVLKPDAQGNPEVEKQPRYQNWRFERAPEGRLVMLRDALEFKQIPEYYRLLQPDPKTGKPRWFRQYVLAPSATIPGDWDVVEIANDPPTDPPIKLKRPLPSLLHRVDDPRVLELADKTAAVHDQEWRPKSERSLGVEEYKSASLPPSAPHDDLLGLASAIAQAHPADAHLAMLRMDALIAARDFKTLETEIAKWRPVLEKPSFLRLPFHRAEAALDAWKLSLAGKNAHELMEKMFGAQTDLTTRLRLTPEVLKYDNLAFPVTTVWMDIQANYLNLQTATKVNEVLSNFLLLQGRRDEALRLLACNYRVGQFLESDFTLISKLIGISIRAICARNLGVYALNACETPQECSALWQWLEYLNAHEPAVPDPTNLKQPLGGIRLEEVVNFLPEWRDVGFLESKGLDSNLLEVATRANVAASKFQLVRMGAAARAHQFASGRLPASAADLAPLLPAGAPPDPFTSAPLRLVQSPAGVTCYSLGPDRADDFAAITYDPSNGSDSRGDLVLEVPIQRQYPFPRGGVRARTPQELLAQFPNGLPPDPFADTKGRPLGISNTSPVYIYSFGPDSDENYDKETMHPEVAYDPTNGTSSNGDLYLQVPWP